MRRRLKAEDLAVIQPTQRDECRKCAKTDLHSANRPLQVYFFATICLAFGPISLEDDCPEVSVRGTAVSCARVAVRVWSAARR
jgi:hypothetical protein